MQLVAYGAQDIYLTGNPQITFFKVVYRRHTNFSMETIQQTINGAPANGNSSTVTISRNGDLVHRVYVTLIGTSVTKGSNIVSEVELEIGGQRIDRHYEEWMNIWNELSTPESKALALKAMQCDVGTGVTTGVGNVQVPLQFWFCRNPGLALPLIALQYHEVKLKFTWGSSHGGGVSGAQVWCDYIYLDTDERRRFAQVSHEYLIEQIQKETLTDASGDHKLNFNHPVKELVWTSSKDYTDAKLVLNGHDRFAAQEEEYFQLRQPFDYHTAVPKQNLPTAVATSTLAFSSYSNQTFKSDWSDGTEATLTTIDTVSTTASAIAYSSNSLTVNGPSGSIVSTTNFVVGRRVAIVITDQANTDAFTGGTTAVGDVFFATITGTATVDNTSANNTLTVPITNFVGGSSGAIELTTIDAGTGTNKAFLYYIEGGDNSAQARTSQMTDKINVYSFGLKPEEHQPSGTCNFSRIDNAQLHFTAVQGDGNIYAVNYNVLRIMSGMGGLAYSN